MKEVTIYKGVKIPKDWVDVLKVKESSLKDHLYPPYKYIMTSNLYHDMFNIGIWDKVLRVNTNRITLSIIYKDGEDLTVKEYVYQSIIDMYSKHYNFKTSIKKVDIKKELKEHYPFIHVQKWYIDITF